VSVSQALPDEAVFHRLHALPGIPGYDEVRLEIAVDGGAFNGESTIFAPGSTLTWHLRDPANPPRLVGLPGWVVANFASPGGSAAIDVTTDFGALLPQLGIGVLPEFVRQNAVSVPLQDPNAAILPLAIGTPLSVVLPPGFPVGFGDVLVEQALHLDPADPNVFKATNETWRIGTQPLSGIVVRAEGANSFNANTNAGFFSVEHLANSTHAAIANVRFDWLASNQPLTEFDTDQGGMLDRFDGGNSVAIGCRGTFRNGSAVATGLDFAATPISPCDPGARTGWIGSNPTQLPGSFSTLDFPFTGGLFGPGGGKFEFDCDTDFGPTSGSGMAGLVVTITLVDAVVLQGVLAADPVDPHVSQLVLP
jgi:hypothetical protein